MTEQQLFTILALHWFADFVCQSDWMAQNKSKRLWPLCVHALAYTAILSLLNPTWAIVNGLLHMLVDGVTSRITSRLYKAKQVHWFFVVIGLDQLIHAVALIWTWNRL